MTSPLILATPSDRNWVIRFCGLVQLPMPRKVMVGNRAGSRQTVPPEMLPILYLSLDEAMERRIKPYSERQEGLARRAQQRRLFRRNQVFGLLIAAVLVIAWTLFHTNRAWIFPAGWWKW